MRRPLALGVALGLVLPALVACGGSDQDAYRGEGPPAGAGDIVGGGEPDSLLKALDVFRDLQDQAPGDITDEWQVVTSIEALQRRSTTRASTPRPTTAHPPTGLSAEDRARIDAAAKQLGSGTTLRALRDLDQQGA